MSVHVSGTLARCREFLSVSELAQLVLVALWQHGVVQRFEPMGLLTARDVIVGILRRKNLFHRDGARALLDELIQELIDQEALQEDGPALVLPILSADTVKTPPVAKDPAVASREAEKLRLAAFRQNRFRVRTANPLDARTNDELDAEYAPTYQPKGAGAPSAPTRDRRPVTPPNSSFVTPVTAPRTGPVTSAVTTAPESVFESEDLENSQEFQTHKHSGNPDETKATDVDARGETPSVTHLPVTQSSVTHPPIPSAVDPLAERRAPVTLALPLLSAFDAANPKSLDRLARLAIHVLREAAGDRFSAVASEPLRVGLAQLLLGSECELAELQRCGAHWRAKATDLGVMFRWDAAIVAGGPVTVGFLVGGRVGGQYEGRGFLAARTAAGEWNRRETVVAMRAAAPPVPAAPNIPGPVRIQGPPPLAQAVQAGGAVVPKGGLAQWKARPPASGELHVVPAPETEGVE